MNERYIWDLTRLYPNDQGFTDACAACRRDLDAFAGRAGTLSGKEAVLSAITAFMALSQQMERIYCYAMMRQNENTKDSAGQAMLDQASMLSSEMGAKTAFFTPELLLLPETDLAAYAEDPDFSDYDVFLQHLLREKEHVLSEPEERLLAMAGEVTGVPDTAAGMLMDADLVLGTIRDEKGNKVPLTDAGFHSFLLSRDQKVRRSAYQRMMRGYGAFGHTFAALYAGQIKADIFASRARRFGSCREAALFPDEVPESVYDSLIEAVHSGIGTLTAYLTEKKEALGLPVLHMYDMYTQAGTDFTCAADIEEAFQLFLDAVRPLGEDYVADASRALDERWIHVYEQEGKRSGAYSCGVYGTTPYVLLNHKPTYDGVSTLCHEMGHAMHTYYSGSQPYAKADYAIFVAEVASTTNEILLCEHLRERYRDDANAQRALIGSMLEHFRTTVFRQTLFAEFEMKAHALAEAGESLTLDRLNEEYLKLNKLYYGKACRVDPDVKTEWMRIPHFYSPFYVYKYATSFCAATALAKNILSGDPEKIAAYRRFLTLGGSMSPIEELKVAGIDMSTPEPVCMALDVFAELVLEYQEYLKR